MGGAILIPSKESVEALAAQTGFRRDMLEKSIHLLALLDVIFEDYFLKDRLVLKCGTALNWIDTWHEMRPSINFDLAMTASVFLCFLFADAGFTSKLGPPGNHMLNFSYYFLGASTFKANVFFASLNIFNCKIVSFSVNRHLMLIRPLAQRIPAISNIESRRQRPISRAIHKKSNVLCVIIMVTCNYVEYHPAELLFNCFHSKP
jgi:hypothetical protein